MGDKGEGLDRLLEAAKAKRTQVQAARDAATDQESRDGLRATSALGLFAARGWWFPIGTIAAVTVPFAIDGLARPVTYGSVTGTPFANGSVMIAEVGAATVGLMIATMIVAHFAVRAAIARELAWLEALPFDVVGHFRLLGRTSGTVTLSFAKDTPDEALLRELAYGLTVPSGTVTVDTDERRLELDIRFGGNPAAGGHPRWRAWRTIVDDLLVPLHARFPLLAVTFR